MATTWVNTDSATNTTRAGQNPALGSFNLKNNLE